MKVLDNDELTVLAAICNETPRRDRGGDRFAAELAKLRGAAAVRHINGVLDAVGHQRAPADDALAQAIDRLGDKIALAMLVGRDDKVSGPTITGAVGAALYAHIGKHNGGEVITLDDEEVA